MKCSILSMVLGQCSRASPQVIWDIIIFPPDMYSTYSCPVLGVFLFGY